MPVIGCEVKYSGPITSLLPITRKLFEESLKETWAEIGFRFFQDFVQKHFTKPGAEEYRGENATLDSGPVYQARSGEGESGKAFWRSYNGRKQKEGRGQLALVYSGKTRDGARRCTLYPSKEGVRIMLPGCVHLNQYKPRQKKYGPHAGDPPLDLRGDLLAISRREADDVRAMHEKIMVSKWGRQFLENHVVTIK